MSSRAGLFDAWAEGYDRSVQGAEGFPFIGYGRVLGEVVARAGVRPGMMVLDLGTGTGNLALLLSQAGAEVWGVDFSPRMLAKARAKVPGARFVLGDVTGPWPDGLPEGFHRIVSGYLLHEFDLEAKVGLLARWARERLLPGGRIVIGDIAFPTAAARRAARERWAGLWDEGEHYWAADEAKTALEGAGFSVTYRQVSPCGGVFTLVLR